MNTLDLVRLIGDIVTELDVIRSDWRIKLDDKIALDNFRDRLDAVQKILIRNAFRAQTSQVNSAAQQLIGLNDGLKKELKDLQGITQALHTLTQLVDILERVAGLRTW